MKNRTLEQLFIEELEDMYSAEKQMIEALPKLIEQASLPALKKALSEHLKETENQVERLEKIFSTLDLSAKENYCEAMGGLLKEADEMIENQNKSPILDAAIIAAAQKVEHYEIASYGTLRSFAKHLNFDGDIIDLLQESLNEEGAADKKLTSIAEGSFFTNGINKDAAQTNSSARINQK